MTALALGYGLSFDDLYDREGLARLDAAFVAWLKDANVDVMRGSWRRVPSRTSCRSRMSPIS